MGLRLGRLQLVFWATLVVVTTTLAWVALVGWPVRPANEADPVLEELNNYRSSSRDQARERVEPAWGRPGGASTLVLYDTVGYGDTPSEAELDGIEASNLASHFGAVQTEPMADYTAGRMDDFDAVVYVGTSETQVLPRTFYADLLDSDTPVLWAGANISDVGATDPKLAARFEDEYGWDPGQSADTGDDVITGVSYRRQELSRDGGAGPIRVPEITAVGQVEVLATTREVDPRPWAVRSGGLTYVGEVPLNAVADTDRYLAFADLYYDLLSAETEPVQQAAVRLTGVSPTTDPDALQEVADYLLRRGIPFQVAVTPIDVRATGEGQAFEQRASTLSDPPRLLSLLKSLEGREAAMVQHGTTHQYVQLANPYDGTSGLDAEFYRAQCSATSERPFEIQPCDDESQVVGTGPVGRDAVDDWVRRLEMGRSAFRDAGLSAPELFETPLDTASPNAYRAMSEVYEGRYERSWYFAGQLSGDQVRLDHGRKQFFPYRVHDLYGQSVVPENLGGLEGGAPGRQVKRDPDDLVSAARANLSVRESLASFSFDVTLGPDELSQIVDGVEGLGYTFVSGDDLN
ncbi:MAG: DUF2334 domain-containing protein [Ornithinimicrobium sp.]